MESILEFILPYLVRRDTCRLRMVCFTWNLSCASFPTLGNRKSPYSIYRNGKLIQQWCVYFKSKLPFIYHQHALSKRMVDQGDTLCKTLTKAVELGEMPSFQNKDARIGYTWKKRNRVGNLGYLLLTKDLAVLRNRILSALPIRVASFGGGPGYDLVGLHLFQTFARKRPPNLSGTIFEFEAGWSNTISQVNAALDTNFDFQHGDLTQPLPDVPSNWHTYQLYTFSFVVMENAKILFESKFIFFHQLFNAVSINATIIFTDSTHRLWRSLYQVAMESENHFNVSITYVKSCHYALILHRTFEACPMHNQTQLATLEELYG